MNSSERRELYNKNRRERQDKARQALLITEYVQKKYYQIYREAAEYYNQLNTRYPTKRDLRRCEQFKKWKKDMIGQIDEPKSPDRSVQRRGGHYYITYHENIPLEPHLKSAESPDVSQSTTNPRGNKVMELRIPLLNQDAVTETLQTVIEETVQEGDSLQVGAHETIQDFTTLHATIEEEIPQDLLDHIISELRTDPDLKTIMTDIEQNSDFEQLGMDLDISDYDRFEEELENMLW